MLRLGRRADQLDLGIRDRAVAVATSPRMTGAIEL
jgi:hypothetical protein